MAKGHRTKIKKDRNDTNKEVRPHAHHMYARISDRKARIVLDQIKNKNVTQAAAILKYSPRYGAYLISKVLQSAVANAEHNYELDANNLYVQEVIANQGPTMKRIQPRAKGMAYRINKRTSHISIYLGEINIEDEE
jgi:large subunit ribosomal protein L22